MQEKITIKLTPYTAMCIYKFLSEFEPDMNADLRLSGLKKCYEEFVKEVTEKITSEQLADAIMDTEINQALGYDPPSEINTKS